MKKFWFDRMSHEQALKALKQKMDTYGYNEEIKVMIKEFKEYIDTMKEFFLKARKEEEYVEFEILENEFIELIAY